MRCGNETWVEAAFARLISFSFATSSLSNCLHNRRNAHCRSVRPPACAYTHRKLKLIKQSGVVCLVEMKTTTGELEEKEMQKKIVLLVDFRHLVHHPLHSSAPSCDPSSSWWKLIHFGGFFFSSRLSTSQAFSALKNRRFEKGRSSINAKAIPWNEKNCEKLKPSDCAHECLFVHFDVESAFRLLICLIN